MRIKAVLFAAMLLAVPLSMRADIYSFTYSGTDLGGGGPFFGSGTFTAQQEGGNPDVLTITGITGTASYDGVSYDITGLVAAAAPSLGNDNLLYYPADPTYFDLAGVAFTLSNGDTENLYMASAGDGYEVGLLEFTGTPGSPGFTGTNAYGGYQQDLQITDLNAPAATPEPSSLLLLGTGLLGGAGAIQRRVFFR